MRLMILNSRNADAIRRLLQSKSDLNATLNSVTGFSLAGMFEFFATAVGDAGSQAHVHQIEKLATARNGRMRKAWLQWTGTTADACGDVDCHAAPMVEFFRLRHREDQTGLPYQLYQERFVRSLKEAEFQRKFAEALAGAMADMTDNVIQHSLALPGEFSGFAGFHILPGYMAFAVIDVGQGVLASLSRSPTWAHLNTASDALQAAVFQHASSRPDQPEGEGFRTLFKSLADRNCRLRFRSDNAVLNIEDAGMHREAAIASSPPLCGLQLSVCCTLKGRPEEKVIDGA
jgi:hypothetical protein